MSKSTRYTKKVVLQVVSALVSGGVQKGTVDIAKQVVQSGGESIIISAGGALVDSVVKDGSTHIFMNVASNNPFTVLVNAKKIKDIICKYRVDIVHVRSRAPAWSCCIAARFTKVRLITTFHSVYSLNNYFKNLYNKIMIQGDVVIAVSNFIKNHLIKYYRVQEDKIFVIHRGVDCDYFSQKRLSQDVINTFKDNYKVPKNTPVILLPARIIPRKGHNILIDAIARIKHLDFYCIISGDISKYESYVVSLKEKICKYKIQDHVQIFGTETNLVALYGIADIVLSSSVQPEAFGRSIIEAQAMEKLVIGTNIGGVSEIIKDQVNGFHVCPNNIEELSHKIEKALSILGSGEAHKIQAAARANVVERFSLNSMLSKTLKVYDI